MQSAPPLPPPTLAGKSRSFDQQPSDTVHDRACEIEFCLKHGRDADSDADADADSDSDSDIDPEPAHYFRWCAWCWMGQGRLHGSTGAAS